MFLTKIEKSAVFAYTQN